MLLANLILELRPLLADPQANLPQITAKLREQEDFAEYEVARHYVAKKLEPTIRAWLDDPDPRVRLEAIAAVRRTFSKPAAAKVLRHLVKDAHLRVRGVAREVVFELGLDDVALRDTTFRVPRNPAGGGGWNPSGWHFGTGSHRGHPRLAPEAVRAGLPDLPDLPALLRWLSLDDEAALRRLMRPGSAAGAAYVDFEVPKKSGGTRLISAPRAPLRAVQRKLLADILAPVPCHDAAHGFVPGRSTVTHAAQHVGAKLLLQTDIRDFFPSIHFWRVRGLFFTLGYRGDVARALAALCTRRPVIAATRTDERRVVWPGVLPQGAPTSPALSNLACRRLDARLSGLAARLGARYSRYADDLSLSFHDDEALAKLDVGRAFWWIDQILQQEGFAEHPKKRRILRPHRRQQVTGIVVNEHLAIPRDERRRFRAMLHNCRAHGLDSQAKVWAQARGHDPEHEGLRADFLAYLRGYAAYGAMVQPKLGARWLAELDAMVQPDTP
ncbi:Retron-type reverse transcriptase [Plesiocystis pacifica SIR-1]|uniref:RNA-directed DNA polymerase n=1 Tax=Plesiocystis pacifica SIR-1 TaxID=391625 RepID=A6GJU6_9BACT|nr:reverse transcriptase family protein [Plesiocystis pacifica]EDM73862.1 Retron-type reverse transcriptase [Plesiocystis pacifica SIR-1]